MQSYIMGLRELIGDKLLLVPSVAAIIHDEQGRLLLQEKSSGEGWSLPAGAIEPGETPQAAAVREVLEEAGLSVVPSRILGVYGGKEFRYVYPNGHQVEYVVTLFKCEIVNSAGNWLDGETKSLRYFSSEEMPKLVLPYPTSVLFS